MVWWLLLVGFMWMSENVLLLLSIGNCYFVFFRLYLECLCKEWWLHFETSTVRTVKYCVAYVQKSWAKKIIQNCCIRLDKSPQLIFNYLTLNNRYIRCVDCGVVTTIKMLVIGFLNGDVKTCLRQPLGRSLSKVFVLIV